MKKYIVSILFMLGCCATTFAQPGKIVGTVLDSSIKVPLELATISVLKTDSSIVTYQLSDKNGVFSIGKLPVKDSLLLRVSYTGYQTYYRHLQLTPKQGDSITVFLALNDRDTNAVVLTSTIPIRMNGDTLEINPAAFKMKQEAVVEELLNQVAGMVIWSDGSITMNGKPVQSLLVNGKPFLGTNDPKIATQNLPKSAVEKIQLYQEYDRSKIGQETRSPQDSLLTMNIKLKDEAKKGYFGKGGGGYGTSDRFEMDLSAQAYNDQSSVGVGGGFNNINKNIGGINEMMQNNTFRSSNPNLYNVGRFGNTGINKNHSIGTVISHSFLKTSNSRQNNRIAINYTKSGADTYLTDRVLQNRTAIANPQFITEQGEQRGNNNRHNLGITYVKTNTYNDEMNLGATMGTSNDFSNSIRFTEVRDSIGQLQSTNHVQTIRSGQSDNEALNIRLAKSNVENPLRGFNLQLAARRNYSASNRNVKSVFESLIDMSKNASYDRNYESENNTAAISATLDYTGFKRLLLGRYNLFGINISFVQRFNYVRSSDQSAVSDYDSITKFYRANTLLSNENKRELIEYTPTLSLSKNFNRFINGTGKNLRIDFRMMEEIKSDRNTSTIAKRNLSRNFRFFRYEAAVNYGRFKQQRYQFNSNLYYNKNYEYPTVDMLYFVVDDINVYDIRIGNPALKNRTNHSSGFNTWFNTQNPKSRYTFGLNINSSYNWSMNAVADSTINDASGKRTLYYVNIDGSRSINFDYNTNISRRIKKSTIQLMFSSQYRNGRTPNYIDSRYNTSTTNNVTHQLNMQFSLRSVLIVNLEKGRQQYKTKQSAAGLNSFKNINRSTRLGVALNWPQNFTVSSTVESINNSNLAKPTYLWNAFATYRFMKQQCEMKVSAMDILKQYQNITNSVNSFGTTTRITNGLQQYFMLTLSYYPRKFGKKAGSQQAAGRRG